MQFAAAQQPQHHQVALGEFDSKASSNNTYNSCKSGCTNYMGLLSSPASYESRRVQRSVSSHSLQKNSAGPHHPFSPLFARLLDSQNGSVRRACSTEISMQYYHHSDNPLSSESSLIIKEMSRTSPYSPEGKKVRIERYRSKRNQRSFDKKIKI
ncbi:uncharacterized protein LOC128195043 [Vigna angularis]|uniref:uncharacterized protein LOC128195043 n=1 Tax=Phaseolus angularis TaxID=3914 RepID=UPI0022B36983|nr:uncharacterized protein LOC128195043 [Vigna angularis]